MLLKIKKNRKNKTIMNPELQFTEIESIIEQYPHAGELLQKWVTDKLRAFQQYISAQMEGELTLPEITEESAKRDTEAIIKTQPHLLYQFFDGNNIRISVMYGHHHQGFQSEIDGKAEYFMSDPLPRIEAEKAAFTRAFKILNDEQANRNKEV